MGWDVENPEALGDQPSIFELPEPIELPEPPAEEHSDPLEPRTYGVREVPLW